MERSEGSASEQPMIKVVIRKRPLNRKEAGRGEQDVVDVPSTRELTVREQKVKVDLTKYVEEHQFKFDHTLDESASNQQVYEECVRPLVQCAFRGAKVTCFAYGQTGSGKTHTMNGDPENGVLGMYYLGASDIFTLRDQLHPNLDIHVSFYEIYCSKLFDLLNAREPLQAREDAKQNVNIVGLTVQKVQDPAQFMAVVAQGSAVRITSQNSTNADSSRSHAILQIELRGGKKEVHGKMTFIDLAGCERGADTLEQNKQTKIDGAEINKSLLALKQCIRALDQGKHHTPFRSSKLTMVLKDSFTGFCKTLMIATVAPSSGSCENTLNTLRYADRVKTLKKGAGSNEAQGRERGQARVESEVEEAGMRLVSNNSSHSYGAPLNPQPPKRMKYILKDENKPPSGHPRKPIISLDHSSEPLKSITALKQRAELPRNKSMVGREKLQGVNNSRAEPLPVSEREGVPKNGSNLLSRKDMARDISVHINHRLTQGKPEESEWNRALSKFRRWAPSPLSFAEMSQLFEDMVRLVMREEVELNDLHRAVLVGEERSQKDLLGLYHETQGENKNNGEMLEWAGRLGRCLEGKARGIAELREKSHLYQQHLREHELCEGRLVAAGELLGQESRVEGHGAGNFFSHQH